MSQAGSHDEPLIHTGFEEEKRPYRDVCWTVLYSALMLFAAGVGVYAIIERNPNWDQLYKQEYLTDPSLCIPNTFPSPPSSTPPPGSPNQSRQLMMLPDPTDVPAAAADVTKTVVNDFWGDGSHFLKASWPFLLAAAGAAVVLGFVFVLLFSYFAIVMVYMTAGIIFLTPLSVGIYYLALGKAIIGGIACGVALLLLILLCCLRTQLNLTSKLLDAAADGLRDNLQLVGFALMSNVAMLVMLAALGMVGIVAMTNGRIEYNTDLTVPCSEDPDEPCCVWNQDNWVTPYFVYIGLMMIWTVFLVSEIRIYVVSGVIAQWYFAGEEDGIQKPGKTRRSLRYALGPSFGTLCLSSLVITIGELLRWVAQKLKRDNKESWFYYMLNCCMQGIISLLEFITEFATVHASITGESFFESGKDVVAMLMRNFLDAYTVWWVPPVVLGASGILISSSAAAIIALSAFQFTFDDQGENRTKWSLYLFGLTLGIILIVIIFFSRLLLDTVSAVFVCFAFDRETRKESKHKVHEIMALMPGVKAIEGGDAAGGERRDRGLGQDSLPQV